MGGLTRWLLPFLIVLATLTAFLPSLQNEFVIWDDDANFLENPHYRGLGWEQLWWMFTTFHMSLYRPLTWVTLGFDYLLWGMEPFGYHLTSLLLHTANAVLFYVLVLRLLSLSLSPPASQLFVLRLAAGFAALLFAIHPLRVETVAWVSARNDVLSAFFFLSAILCYLRAVTVAGAYRIWMPAAVVVYALSLLSKAAGIVLPIIFLTLDVYPLRRLGWGSRKWFGPQVRGVWLEKAPFLLFALGAGALAATAKYYAGAMVPWERQGLESRLAQTLYSLGFYLWKTVIPVSLSPLYQMGPKLSLWYWPFFLSPVAVVAISVISFAVRRRWPAFMAAWIYYVVAALPVSGIAQAGPQIAADRYTYLSCLGWALLAGAGAFYGSRLCFNGTIARPLAIVFPGVQVVLIAVLGLLTWKQVQVWKNSETLWRHALSTGQKSSRAHYNLGVTLESLGDLETAMKHYREALQIQPDYAEAHNNLGVALASRGRLDEAIKHYRQAVRINPAYANAHYNLGNVLTSRNDLDEAIRHYREAVRINPDFGDAHNNLGAALTIQGELDEAIKYYREALRVNPNYANAHYNLGLSLLRRGKLDAAIVHFREAVRVEPEFAEAHDDLARALAQQGKKDEAVKHYQEAVRIMKSRRQAP
jgi:Tfp pilus assembly protein PilF